MTNDLATRLDDVCESLERQRKEFEEAILLCGEIIKNMSERMERVEQWMLEKNKLKLAKIKTP
jgi:prefoldin subunit 5